jgi:glyoxylase I family protein
MLASDVRIVTNGGGKVRSALEVIEGADRAARFLVEVTRKRPGAWWRDDFTVRFATINDASKTRERCRMNERLQGLIGGFWGVRYQVKDVQRASAFYTKTLGFNLDMQNLPAFGQVSIGGLKLILSGPGASGSRPMPDGRQQEPGGWNRVLLQVQDLGAVAAHLKEAGLRFRNEMEVGPGGKQIQIEDPDGNPIELFEPARR